MAKGKVEAHSDMSRSVNEGTVSFNNLFRRCVLCPSITPQCPTCREDEICAQIAQSCNSCASAQCVKNSLSGATNTGITGGSSKGPNVGAIAGGVVGGVVAVAIITYLLWRFYFRGRRQQMEEVWEEDDVQAEKAANNDFTLRRDARASTHTVGSIASTVLTRASNVIQIAYIPGVTNRSAGDAPDRLVPPVPPIPLALNNSQPGSPYSHQDALFFSPGDLRGSTYSGLTDDDGRSVRTRASITPSLARSSVATTIYRNDAVLNPMPAQTIVRGKAAVVSVKSSGSSSPAVTPGASTPPVPAIDYEKHSRMINVQIPTGSDLGPSPIGSVRSAASASKPSPLNITKFGKAKAVDIPGSAGASTVSSANTTPVRVPRTLAARPITEISIASTDTALTHARARRITRAETEGGFSDSESDDEDSHERSRRSLMTRAQRDSEITEIQDTPATMQSPFTDATITPTSPDATPRQQNVPRRGSSRLSRVIEEANRRASRSDVFAEEMERAFDNVGRRDPSPFSDDNEIKR